MQLHDFLERQTQPAPQTVTVGHRLLRTGSRVRLQPRMGGSETMDRLLTGRLARIESIVQDLEGDVQLVVTVEDAGTRLPGAASRHPCHRFFFKPADVEAADPDDFPRPRVLAAGIGNVFLGDDGFGVAVAQRLLDWPLPAELDVMDIGICGIDLAYALGRSYRAAILIDALHLGFDPGTVHVMEPDLGSNRAAGADAHRLHPEAVLQLARQLGPLPEHIRVVGCEPSRSSDLETPEMALSDPVAAAVDCAAAKVLELAYGFLADGEPPQQEKAA